jgi:hypothetical protein
LATAVLRVAAFEHPEGSRLTSWEIHHCIQLSKSEPAIAGRTATRFATGETRPYTGDFHDVKARGRFFFL